MYKRLFVLCKSVVSHDVSDITLASPRRLSDTAPATRIPSRTKKVASRQCVSFLKKILHYFSYFVGFHYCLSNKKFERLGSPLDEIVTISVHKINVIMTRLNMIHSFRET